ncbi:hypothetical protein D3C78_1112500 [compost metagenome]
MLHPKLGSDFPVIRPSIDYGSGSQRHPLLLRHQLKRSIGWIRNIADQGCYFYLGWIWIVLMLSMMGMMGMMQMIGALRHPGRHSSSFVNPVMIHHIGGFRQLGDMDSHQYIAYKEG